MERLWNLKAAWEEGNIVQFLADDGESKSLSVYCSWKGYSSQQKYTEGIIVELNYFVLKLELV